MPVKHLVRPEFPKFLAGVGASTLAENVDLIDRGNAPADDPQIVWNDREEAWLIWL